MDDRLAYFAALLRDRFGLALSPERGTTLARAVAAGMVERELASAGAYLELLASDDTALQRLASLATTSETYFFRHPEQLRAVETYVVPAIIDDRRWDPEHVLRVWSAGCASGEEAYSLAIVVQEALLPVAAWSARVVGTDLDAEAIARAESASYGRWSFRDMDPRWSGWFTGSAGGSMTVDPRIRSRVTFAVQNLAAPDARPPAALGGEADLVVCRNVLMYLHTEAARRTVDLVYRSLRPGGWLATGPTEIAPHFLRRFERTTVDGMTLYRRPEAEPKARDDTLAAARTHAPAAAVLPSERGPRIAGRAPHRPAGRRSDPGHASLDPDPPLVRARRLADSGRHREAQAVCSAILRAQPGNPEAHRLLADIAEAEGDLPAVRAALRRLLGHAPDDLLAQFRLALVERRQADYEASQRTLAALVARTAHLPDDEQLDQAGELSAGRLRSIAATMLLGQDHD